MVLFEVIILDLIKYNYPSVFRVSRSDEHW